MEALWALGGLVVGVALTWFLMKQVQSGIESRMIQAIEGLKKQEETVKQAESKIETLISELQESNVRAEGLRVRLKERDDAHEQRLAVYRDAEDQLKDTFKALSGDALKASTEQLVAQADEVLKRYREAAEGDDEARKKEIENLLNPVRENLQRLDEQNQAMERHRAGAYKELTEQLRTLSDQQSSLKTETGRLVKALQDPGSAGSWGEMVLERVVEMAGLQEYSSYATQETMDGEDGKQRPDMVIMLPGGRALVIDSKAPMRSYVTALETEDEATKEALLVDHAHKLLLHARELKKRDYAKVVQSAPDFVVLFIPSESAYRVAVERRPALFEEAHEANVVMATPTTLLALLKAVAYGWKQETLAASARQLQNDAALLYDRVCKIASDYVMLGKALASAGRKYNEMGATLESRVLPAARKFKDHGVQTNTEMASIEPLEFAPRPLQSPELAAGSPAALPGIE